MAKYLNPCTYASEGVCESQLNLTLCDAYQTLLSFWQAQTIHLFLNFRKKKFTNHKNTYVIFWKSSAYYRSRVRLR